MKKLLLLLIIPLLFACNNNNKKIKELDDFYSSQGHPKAKGLNFKIKKPLGFEQMEGDRPNILQKWIKHKDNNDLMQTFVIMIKKSPLKMNSQEWKSVLLDEDGVNIIPDLMHEGLPYQNLKIQKKQYFEVDLCPGIYWESSYRVNATNRIPNLTEKIYINQYNLNVMLFLGDYSVIFGYNVINQDVLDEKLFYKWILSFVFNEQWDETKTGTKRILPPLPDENNQPQESQMLKNNILVIQLVANKKDVVLIETGAQDSGQGFPLELVKLKNFIKDFVDNNGKDVNLSERPDKAVISIKSSAKAYWETFIATQDAISAAYKEMRNTSSINKFGKEYEDLNEEENKEIKKIYPLKLTETVKEN